MQKSCEDPKQDVSTNHASVLGTEVYLFSIPSWLITCIHNTSQNCAMLLFMAQTTYKWQHIQIRKVKRARVGPTFYIATSRL